MPLPDPNPDFLIGWLRHINSSRHDLFGNCDRNHELYDQSFLYGHRLKCGRNQFSDGMPLRILMWVTAISISILYTIRYAEKVRLNPAASLVADQAESDRERFLVIKLVRKIQTLPIAKNFH